MKPDISCWQSPPASIRLKDGELHLWRLDLERLLDESDMLQVLSPDEGARAKRLIHPRKRHQFIAARYGLRHVLAHYLPCAPASIKFNYGPLGKPAVRFEQSIPIDFNLAHSGCWGFVAVAPPTGVGVDLEQIVAKDNLQSLADYAFDAEERKIFATFGAARRLRGFYRLWTAKEAKLKLLGVGLSEMTSDFSPQFHCFCAPARGYMAAVAAAHDIASVVRYHYPVF